VRARHRDRSVRPPDLVPAPAQNLVALVSGYILVFIVCKQIHTYEGIVPRATIKAMPKKALFYILTDLGPTFVFFIAGKFTDFYTATLSCVIATICIVVFTYIRERRVTFFPLIVASFIVISGTLTYVLSAPNIIIFADTVYYSVVAGTLGLGLFYNRLFLKTLFQDTYAVTDPGWKIITVRWCVVFALAALINEILRITVTPEQWLEFRFYKILAISLFGLYQFRVAMRYRIVGESNRFGLRI
jgi:intracellular septation protein